MKSSGELREKVIEALSETLNEYWTRLGLARSYQGSEKYWHSVNGVTAVVQASKERVRRMLNNLVREGLVKKEVKERSFPLYFIYYLRNNK